MRILRNLSVNFYANYTITEFERHVSNILTQTFVSRKHYEIFSQFFTDKIKNWYCDNWINQIYSPDFVYPLHTFRLLNGIPNTIESDKY